MLEEMYVLQSLAVPSDVLDKVNRLLFRFLWKNKFSNTRAFEKVKRTVVCSPKEMGGLQMINIKDMHKSFILAWASKLQDPKKESWKVIPCFLIGQIGQSYACFLSTIQSKEFIGLRQVRSVFWHQVLTSWLDCRDQVLEQEIMNNNDILIGQFPW